MNERQALEASIGELIGRLTSLSDAQKAELDKLDAKLRMLKAEDAMLEAKEAMLKAEAAMLDARKKLEDDPVDPRKIAWSEEAKRDLDRAREHYYEMCRLWGVLATPVQQAAAPAVGSQGPLMRAMFLIRADFTTIAGLSCTFRSMLGYFLKKETQLPHGTCTRDDLKISIRFTVETVGERDRVLDAIDQTLDATAETIEGDVSTIKASLRAIHAINVPLSEIGEPWRYVPNETSPHKAVFKRSDARDVKDVDASWCASSPTKRSAASLTSDPSDGTDNAHITFSAKYKKQMRSLLEEYIKVPNVDEAYLAYGPDGPTIKLDAVEHRNYDKLLYFYAWRFDRSGEAQWRVSLQPRLMSQDHQDSLNIRSLLVVDLPNDQEKIRWHRTLVLRKYLTVMMRDRKVSQRTILQEWNGESDQSLCWEQ